MDFTLVFIYKGVYGGDVAGYGIYLINSSDNEYKVTYHTGGFFSVDDDLVELKKKTKQLGVLQAHGRILIEEQDIGGLDMVGYVYLTLKGSNNYRIRFDIGKGAPVGKSIRLDGFSAMGIQMRFEIEEFSE